MSERFASGYNDFVLPFLIGMAFVITYCLVALVRILLQLPAELPPAEFPPQGVGVSGSRLQRAIKQTQETVDGKFVRRPVRTIEQDPQCPPGGFQNRGMFLFRCHVPAFHFNNDTSIFTTTLITSRSGTPTPGMCPSSGRNNAKFPADSGSETAPSEFSS